MFPRSHFRFSDRISFPPTRIWGGGVAHVEKKMVCRGMDGDRGRRGREKEGEGGRGKERGEGEEGRGGERGEGREGRRGERGKERREKEGEGERGKEREMAYLSFQDIIKPLQQLNHGTLATSTGTHQRDCLPWFHRQTEVFQNLRATGSQVPISLVPGNTTLQLR